MRDDEAPIRIGLDFDNTLACYDELFFDLALERGLIDLGIPHRKQAVRDHLRARGLETEWTTLQGIAYGERLLEAPPFPGVLDLLEVCRLRGWKVCIISHKTREPVIGPAVDLHQAALRWLDHHGLLEFERTGITAKQVWFEPNRCDKRRRIAERGCTHFVDDLLDFLCEPGFPSEVVKIHFDPCATGKSTLGIHPISHWSQIERLVDRCGS